MAGGEGVHAIASLLGVWGMFSHKILKLVPSEITSGAFSDSFVVFK